MSIDLLPNHFERAGPCPNMLEQGPAPSMITISSISLYKNKFLSSALSEVLKAWR
jgi:hypothetical protein